MAGTFPIADSPGENTQLRPELAPDWLSPALDVRGEDVLKIINRNPERHEAPAKSTAAVLMLIGGTNREDATVLLTHRSPHMRSHSGQIAFPGGRIDPPDVNIVDTALREAWEETGLDRKTVIPLADWGETCVPVRRNRITAVLAHWNQPSQVGVVNTEEADDVFVLPISELRNPENRLMLAWDRWRSPSFRINDYIIWGFTAAALTTLLDKTGWATEWDMDRTFDLHETIAASRNNERRV